MLFAQDFIETVREANNIVEIIGQYTELKGSGHRFMGRCPFPDHSDKSPSFSVNEDSQLYHCFGCKKSGNAYTFLQTFSGMSFPEAVEFLARRASIPLPEKEEKQLRTGAPTSEQKDLLLRVNRAAAVFYHQQLKSLSPDHPARQYLVKRGLSDEIVEKFRLGVALDDWQGLIRYFRARNVPIPQAETLGLIKPKKGGQKGDTHFDLFRDRLMFPIFSPSNDVVGFGGRTLGEALPKYVNSSDSPVFHKGRVFYGLHETGKFIRAQDEAIVVEGYMDAISLYAAGIKNVVAILGTAFTPDHAKVLKRYTLNVKVLLDGDEAGVAGAERSLPILLETGLMPKGFVLPDKMDPDDYVKNFGADQLRAEIEKAPELFTLLLAKRWMQNYHGSPSEKVQIVEEAGRILRGMQNRQLQELYLLELARQLDVDMRWVRRALADAVQAGLKGPASRAEHHGSSEKAAVNPDIRSDDELETAYVAAEPLVSMVGAPRDEAFVLSLLVHSESLMKELMEAGADELLKILSHEGIRRITTLAIEKYRQKPGSFDSLAASLASQIDQPSILTSSLELKRGMTEEAEERRLMSDYLKAIRKRFFKNQGKALTKQIRDQASPEKLEQFMNIQRNRLSLNRD